MPTIKVFIILLNILKRSLFKNFENPNLAINITPGTPWARATKKVHKPPGEKGRMFRKSKILLNPKYHFSFSNCLSFFTQTSAIGHYV